MLATPLSQIRDPDALLRFEKSRLTRRYLARIDAYDRAGPGLNAVREVNPDALAIAVELDAKKPATRRPLEGIPILIKDNIATADRQHTTAGALALAEARAKRDATVTRLLRDAGAIILGKANLTESVKMYRVWASTPQDMVTQAPLHPIHIVPPAVLDRYIFRL